MIMLSLVMVFSPVFDRLSGYHYVHPALMAGRGSVLQAAIQEQTVVGLPLRLRIPAIHVDAVVERVGIASDGAMDVPKGPLEVGWFDLGPRPGEKGNAVIDGHFGTIKGIPAVFNNLYTLRAGDKIYIEHGQGTITTFVVRELKRFGPTDDAVDVFVSSDGKAHLNLITCEGEWNKITKLYSERLVVFADVE